MVNAQEWLDKNYPINSTCQLEADSENFGKKRDEVKELDISCQNLEGKLKLEGFYNLHELDCSENKIISLDLYDSENLFVLNCEENLIENLNICSSLNGGVLTLPHGVNVSIKENKNLVNLEEDKKKLKNELIEFQNSLMKRYFNLLVQQFLKDRLDIVVVIKFVDSFKNPEEDSKTLILDKTWWEINQKEKKITIQVSFLNYYKNEEVLRKVLVSEFTRAYLKVEKGSYVHDDYFYEKMEDFEDWLDKNQGLNPRKNKSEDRDQHVNFKKKECIDCEEKELTTTGGRCSECYQIKKDNEKSLKEYQKLLELVKSSQNLDELEKNYQKAKEETHNDLFAWELDNCYNKIKEKIQSQEDELTKLKTENQELKNKVEQLEEKNRQLELKSQIEQPLK